jgi:hypothetical protein
LDQSGAGLMRGLGSVARSLISSSSNRYLAITARKAFFWSALDSSSSFGKIRNLRLDRQCADREDVLIPTDKEGMIVHLVIKSLQQFLIIALLRRRMSAIGGKADMTRTGRYVD